MFDVCWGTHCQVYCPYPFAHFIQLFVKQGRRSDHLNFLACFRCCWLCQWTWGAFLIIYNIRTRMYVGWLVGIFGTAFHYLFFEKIYMCMYVGNNYTGHVHLPMKHVLILTHVWTYVCRLICFMYDTIFRPKSHYQRNVIISWTVTGAKDTIHGFCSVFFPLNSREIQVSRV